MNKEILSRKELYELVWKMSLLALSKKYDISGNGLRKICNRMNIPLPENGHWTKVQFGKKVKIKPLPALHEGEEEVVLSLRTEDGETSNGTHHPDAILAKEISNVPRLSLIVPAKLSSPDKLIIAAKERLTGKDAFTRYRYKGIVSGAGEVLDIKVTPKNINRALRFMDTLIKSLRVRGHEIVIKNRFTYVNVKGQSFRICFREQTKRVVIPGKHWNSSEYHPVDILYFKYDGYSSKEWKDGKQPLENYLPDILVKLETASDELTAQQQFHQRNHEERKNKKQLLQEIQERKEKELADFKSLLEKAERWHKAANLRNYIDAMEQFAASNGDIPKEMGTMLDWARKKADWYDPFMETEDELLKEVDRATISF